MLTNLDSSFHVRFTEPGFVSRFLPIPVKRETNHHFTPRSPLISHGKGMKRSGSKTEAFVSPKIGFVSRRFTFRFKPCAAPKSSCHAAGNPAPGAKERRAYFKPQSKRQLKGKDAHR